MIVTYRDELGCVQVILDDEYDIGFLNGYAYFRSNKKSYKIKVENLVSIGKID